MPSASSSSNIKPITTNRNTNAFASGNNNNTTRVAASTLLKKSGSSIYHREDSLWTRVVPKISKPSKSSTMSAASSDSGGNNNANAKKQSQDSRDSHLAKLMDMFPNKSAEDITAVLVASGWDLLVAEEHLIEGMAGEGGDDLEPAPKKRKLVKITKRRESKEFDKEEDEVKKGASSASASGRSSKLVRKGSAKKMSRREDDSDEYGGSDDDGGYSDSGSEGRYEERDNTLLLEFFNNVSIKELMDTLVCAEDQDLFIVDQRPFSDADDLRTKLQSQKRKKLGNLITRYEEIMEGYQQVDGIIRQCEEVGDKIMKVVKTWSSSATTTTTSPSNSKPTTPNVFTTANASPVGSKVASPSSATAGVIDIDAASDEVETGQLSFTQFDPSAVSQVSKFFGKDYEMCITKQPAIMSEDVQLKGYQLLGVSWLNLLYRKKCGAILADE
ncbi:hypothetical protein HDU76_012488, partial [Blyttiomyces sp. JEL0837]